MNFGKQHIDSDELLIQGFLNGELSATDMQSVIVRLEKDPVFKNSFDECYKSVSWLDKSYIDSKLDEEAAFAKFEVHSNSGEIKKVSFGRKLLKYAAILTVLISSSWIIFNSKFQSMVVSLPLFESATHIHAALDNKDVYRLPDNSEVWLGAGSDIKYEKRFNKRHRHLSLNGKAYFEVEHNKELPFVVEIDDFRVEVVGTSFGISSVDSSYNIHVNVDEGTVMLYQQGDTSRHIVDSGFVGVYNTISKQIVITEIQDLNHKAWVDGKLIFYNCNLSLVLKELNAHYDKKIVIKDPEILDLPVTATFDNEDLDTVLEILSFIHGLAIEEVDQTITLSLGS